MTIRAFSRTLAALLLTSISGAACAVEVQTAEVVAELPEAVGNIGFTPDNRVIYSHHPFFSPAVRVAELDADRRSGRPFPNLAWNTPRKDNDHYLDSVLGLRGDAQGVIWMLDMGTRSGITPKLVGWNTRTDRLERIYHIPSPASRPESQLNDFAIDAAHGAFYIADEGIGPGGDGTQAALVVVDMRTGASRRLLEGHASVLPEDVPIAPDGRELRVPAGDGKPVRLRVGADGIALDRRAEWLYFGPLNGGWLYRVRTADLLDSTLSARELGQRVERYARKPNNGGLSIDDEGNLYLTEVEQRAVGVIAASDRQYRRLAAHPDLIWPDGVSHSPDGWLYVSAAQLSEVPIFNNGKALHKPPYYIFRFKPLARGRLGN
ncbi:L-dopachrome tautomerase-related protein [Methyloversatilis thermotolerans]|uniref:L-dopachrome tautomerase-related protein n=1 Tax=Methyloversatilis thermotolerans TaxID=1346290 RepID=UPI000382CBCC|nr:L-dopachrome tautomerase-related protein [Methyloversatilis thermotolerans]